jgi:molecular chaperone HtpG
MTAEELATHAELTKTALVRWCRYAQVPITFTSVNGYDGGEVVAINTALSVAGLASVRVTEGDETFAVAVGAPGSFAGFYNRGLTLMESTEPEPVLETIHFKIDSPHLSHTMSRDSIRRDDESRRLIERIRSLVTGPLAVELEARIAEAAVEAASAPTCERYAALLAAHLTLPNVGNAAALALPLLEPLDGATTILLGEATHGERTPSGDPLLFADTSTPLTRAVAATGRAIVRHMVLAAVLRGALGDDTEPAYVDSTFAYARETQDHAEDEALLDELTRLLSAAGRTVARARIATFHGSSKDSSCRVTRTSENEALLVAGAALERRWAKDATIFLNVEHATVRLARRRAKTDVAVAAQLLCRTILLDEGPLAAKVVDRLLEAAALPVSHDG